MDKTVLEWIKRNNNKIVEYWLMYMKKEECILSSISKDLYVQTNQAFIEHLLQEMKNNNKGGDGELQTFVNHSIQIGFPLRYFIRGIQFYQTSVFELLSKSNEEMIESKQVYLEITKWVNGLSVDFVHEYSEVLEKQVSLQKLAIKELSAPVIPVFDKISVMPLIGTIDTERAQLMMENLLDGIIEYRSEVVLIDITGVPIVDTMVAHHIIHISQAVRLVGAKCILVGIRPEIAQTIIHLGIDLSDIQTRGTLDQGIELALELQNKKIIKID
ncbi:MAG TPA: STAS domain-containing protein [Massilibacterium sp.]|nr:STAS domain-containing protein [Massilibacterium sp.]